MRKSARLVATTSDNASRRPGGAASGSAASRNPIDALPTSPRKIRAGAQLRVRKPAALAAAATETTPGADGQLTHASAAKDTTACPPASPSAPSMKLKK